jgi:DNA-directed RNA polymerase specialized sigma24 family protein
MFNNPNVRRRLQGLVQRLAANNGLHDDMMQEALIHLWQSGERHPGQRPAWYLQACRFHLQNYLRLGRSVDSGKHFLSGLPQPINGQDSEEVPRELHTNGDFLDEVTARDLVSVLSRWLTMTEKQVLDCLADGLSAREIAKRLNISHTRVNSCRRHIGLLALKSGITPLGEYLPRKSRGSKSSF